MRKRSTAESFFFLGLKNEEYENDAFLGRPRETISPVSGLTEKMSESRRGLAREARLMASLKSVRREGRGGEELDDVRNSLQRSVMV